MQASRVPPSHFQPVERPESHVDGPEHAERRGAGSRPIRPAPPARSGRPRSRARWRARRRSSGLPDDHDGVPKCGRLSRTALSSSSCPVSGQPRLLRSRLRNGPRPLRRGVPSQHPPAPGSLSMQLRPGTPRREVQRARASVAALSAQPVGGERRLRPPQTGRPGRAKVGFDLAGARRRPHRRPRQHGNNPTHVQKGSGAGRERLEALPRSSGNPGPRALYGRLTSQGRPSYRVAGAPRAARKAVTMRWAAASASCCVGASTMTLTKGSVPLGRSSTRALRPRLCST